MYILIFCLTALVYLLFPSLNLWLFAPFLISTYYFRPLTISLLWSAAAGLLIDLTTFSAPLGTHALIFCLTTAFLYDKKQHFFLDNLSTFPLMTALFSVLSTLLLTLFCGCPLSPAWFMGDLLLLPLGDALFAFFCYTLPFVCMGPKRRAGHEYFL